MSVDTLPKSATADTPPKSTIQNQNKFNLKVVLPLARKLRQAWDKTVLMKSRHFPSPKNVQIDARNNPYAPNERVKHIQNLWLTAVFNRFFAEQGAAREYIRRGLNQELVKSPNQTLIANRGALIAELKKTSLPRLAGFAKANLPISNTYIKLENKLRQLAELESENELKLDHQKLLTIDISKLKAIDIAGEGDYLLNEVAQKMILASQQILDMPEFQDPDGNSLVELQVYRPGGDEFSGLLKAPNQKMLNRLEQAFNQVLVEQNIKQIETSFAIVNSNGGTDIVSGNVEIKNGKPFDESRPEVEPGNEESEIKALLYDLILCEINLVPDNDHLESAFEDVKNTGGSNLSLKEKFTEYFKIHFEAIASRETTLPEYLAFNQIDDDTFAPVVDDAQLDLDVKELCDRFPGIQILVDIAKKADKTYVDQLKSQIENDSKINPNEQPKIKIGPERVNFNLRQLIQLLSENLFDPVIGEKVYNKHAFDEMMKFKQLGGLMVFKEVIKPVNDKLGLANGDKVIRDFFHTIKSQIPSNLEKYVIYGRGQADILIGFNINLINKIEDEQEREAVMQQINNLIDKLSQMQSFESDITKNNQNIKFKMNLGVGYAKLNPENGYLDPADMNISFNSAETDFDIKYIAFILKNNPQKIVKTLLTESNISSKLNSEPDLWNLHTYLNDPKRGVINTSRLLHNLQNNRGKLLSDTSIDSQNIFALERGLKILKSKLELEMQIRQLTEENKNLEEDIKSRGQNILQIKLPTLKLTTNLDQITSYQINLNFLKSQIDREFPS